MKPMNVLYIKFSTLKIVIEAYIRAILIFVSLIRFTLRISMNLNAIPFNRAQIYLLFYKPVESDPFQNKLVAYFNGPFCHVELAFPEKYGQEPWEKNVLGSSIYQDETVFLKPKSYNRHGYVSCALELTSVQCHKIKSYCRTQMNNKVPFSKISMYSAFLPVQLFDLEGTFCSKHVTMALQYANVSSVAGLNPHITTPSSLYRHIMSFSPILQIVPSKMSPSNIIPCCANLVRDLMQKQKKVKDNLLTVT